MAKRLAEPPFTRTRKPENGPFYICGLAVALICDEPPTRRRAAQSAV